MTKRYLVTGGAGFIGSHLTERLLAEGHEVTVLDDLSTGRHANLAAVEAEPRLRVIIGSASDRPLVEPLVRECDRIFHLASPVGVRLIMERPIDTVQGIFASTDVMLSLASRYRRRVLFTSTSEVYGKSADVPFKEDGDRLEGPTSFHRWAYACAKALDEFLALAHYKTTGLPVVIVRLFNTVGPRQSSQYGMVIPTLIEAALHGRPIIVHGDGQQSRCFLHVSDAVDGIMRAMNEQACTGQVLNLGSDEEITIQMLAQRIQALTGSRSPIENIPYSEAYPEGGFEDMRRRVPSLERIRSLTGWTPCHSLDQILAAVIDDRGGTLMRSATQDALAPADRSTAGTH